MHDTYNGAITILAEVLEIVKQTKDAKVRRKVELLRDEVLSEVADRFRAELPTETYKALKR
jgi:hypothetical protein